MRNIKTKPNCQNTFGNLNQEISDTLYPGKSSKDPTHQKEDQGNATSAWKKNSKYYLEEGKKKDCLISVVKVYRNAAIVTSTRMT